MTATPLTPLRRLPAHLGAVVLALHASWSAATAPPVPAMVPIDDQINTFSAQGDFRNLWPWYSSRQGLTDRNGQPVTFPPFAPEDPARQAHWTSFYSGFVGPDPVGAAITHPCPVPAGACASPSAAILDYTTTTSTIGVATPGVTVASVTVRLTITHTYVGDLVVTLVSPAGTRVVLVNRSGGPGRNFIGTELDDEAPAPISAGAAPFTGTFRPETPLDAVNGETVGGVWTLEVSDVAAGDIGTLDSWCIRINGGASASAPCVPRNHDEGAPVYLMRASFGQPFASTVAYGSVARRTPPQPGVTVYDCDPATEDCSIAGDAIKKARLRLYYDEPDANGCTLVAPAIQESFDAGVFCRENAAFRYKNQLYGKLIAGSDKIVNALEAQGALEGIGALAKNGFEDVFYGNDERGRAEDAEVLLRNALVHGPPIVAPLAHDESPGKKTLHHALLDLYYDRAAAELILGRETLQDTLWWRMTADVGSSPASDSVILGREIADYEQLLDGCDVAGTETRGSFRCALKGYFELLQDNIGVTLEACGPTTEEAEEDPDRPTGTAGAVVCVPAGELVEGEPLGRYLFRKLVPGRDLYAAEYSTVVGGTLVTEPVLKRDGVHAKLLFSGYKDLVLIMQVLTEEAEAAQELIRLYAMRDAPATADEDSDRAKAAKLLRTFVSRSHAEGSIFLNVFGEENLSQAAEDPTAEGADTEAATDPARTSGLREVIGRWRSALARLATAQGIVTGKSNPLGFPEDFLFLVAGEAANNQATYDLLRTLLVTGAEAADGPYKLAETAFNTAKSDWTQYHGFVSELETERNDRGNKYLPRLREISGADFCCPQQAEYNTPENNEGSLVRQQLLNIQEAKLGIEKNEARIRILKQQATNELESWAVQKGIREKMADTVIEYGDQQAKLTEELGRIEGEQSYWNGIAGTVGGLLNMVPTSGGGKSSRQAGSGAGIPARAASAPERGQPPAVQAQKQFPVVVAVIAAKVIIGAIQAQNNKGWARAAGSLKAQKERLAAMEKADMIRFESQIMEEQVKTRIKNMLLEMETLEIESAEAALRLKMELEKLKALLDEREDLEKRWAQETQIMTDRYYADSTQRLRLRNTMIDADATFREAQGWVFMMARALDYKWNYPWEKDGYSTQSVLRARNFSELKQATMKMGLWNLPSNLSCTGHTNTRVLSVRRDVLGFQDDAAYAAPDGGPAVDAISAFQAALAGMVKTQGGSQSLAIPFSTFRKIDGGGFFDPDVWDEKITDIAIRVVGTRTSAAPISGHLVYGTTGYVRNQQRGVSPGPGQGGDQAFVAGEMTAWAAQNWAWDLAKKEWVRQPAFDRPVEVVLNNVDNTFVPPDTIKNKGFKELGIAATDWELRLPLGAGVLQVNEIHDIQLWFDKSYCTDRVNP